MTSDNEKVRAAIAEQAGDWFVGHDEGLHDVKESAALAAWLKTSPVHIEEFLGFSVIARDLREARAHPEYSLEAILARANAAEESRIRPLRHPPSDAFRVGAPRRWLTATGVMAACAFLSIGLYFTWNGGGNRHPGAAPDSVTALHFETRHGEQLTRRLADGSVLHLNTDTAISIRYSKHERLAVLSSGEADFEVAHEAVRSFRALVGSIEVSDLGTKFDVRLGLDSTVVTVVEGEVKVGPTAAGRPAGSPWTGVRVGADHQLVIANGVWPPPRAVALDAERATAWLHRQIAFDHEPLEKVAAEFNRYAPKPIEIATPGLQKMQVSGVFATDDPEAFIAFLRSLKGVRVEVTETRIRVW
jgi:transmembrane sensor